MWISITHTIQELRGLTVATGSGSIVSAFAIRTTISPDKHQKMTRKLVRFLICGMHPITTLLAEEFREFCAALHPDYIPPGTDTLKSIVLCLYEKTRALVCTSQVTVLLYVCLLALGTSACEGKCPCN